MVQRRVWKVVPAAGLIIALLALGASWALGQDQRRDVEGAVQDFYLALAEQDWNAAGDVTTRSFKERMQRKLARGEPLRSAPPRVEVNDVMVHGDIAWARVRLGTVLASGQWDVLWHRVELVRGEDGWSIARVENSSPMPTGSGKPASADFSPAAFQRYLAAVATGDWEAARNELAGPALMAHEASRTVLGRANAGLFESYSEPAFAQLWAEPGMVIVRADYTVDQRPVAMRVTFYRTGERWRVVDVLDISR